MNYFNNVLDTRAPIRSHIAQRVDCHMYRMYVVCVLCGVLDVIMCDYDIMI